MFPKLIGLTCKLLQSEKMSDHLLELRKIRVAQTTVDEERSIRGNANCRR